eukprot:GHVR01141811.1.p2 GENE.GHVR01141811.1~~GHVR01141811.1.p2  ORF type:complete len:122 (-),score=43.09 GHVR01141811.1:1336-1701(-)
MTSDVFVSFPFFSHSSTISHDGSCAAFAYKDSCVLAHLPTDGGTVKARQVHLKGYRNGNTLPSYNEVVDVEFSTHPGASSLLACAIGVEIILLDTHTHTHTHTRVKEILETETAQHYRLYA